jgi:hypothetical protein
METRKQYEFGELYGFIQLTRRVDWEDLDSSQIRKAGSWWADCLGVALDDPNRCVDENRIPSEPSVHPGEYVTIMINTRDLYYNRARSLACERCQPALNAWLASKQQRSRPVITAQTHAPAPVHQLVVGRLFLDEWIPLQGWLCACLCGCGQYETVRTTQLTTFVGMRPCPVTGRVRPALGTVVTYESEKRTDIRHAVQAEA